MSCLLQHKEEEYVKSIEGKKEVLPAERQAYAKA